MFLRHPIVSATWVADYFVAAFGLRIRGSDSTLHTRGHTRGKCGLDLEATVRAPFFAPRVFVFLCNFRGRVPKRFSATPGPIARYTARKIVGFPS